MFIWVAINVDEQLKKLKQNAMLIDKRLGFEHSCAELPYHISLKILFEIDNEIYDSVISELEKYYSNLVPFTVNVKSLEKYKNIIWIKMARNKQLNKIHKDLNEILFSKYNIGLHELDSDFIFHTSLFIDDDSLKINKAYSEIKNEFSPKKLYVNKFIIGTSKSGEIGTYSVLKEVNV